MTTKTEIKDSLIKWANGDLSQSPPSEYSEARVILWDAILYENGEYDCSDNQQRRKAIDAIEAFAKSAEIDNYATA